MRRATLVVITGIDGAGKSSLARNLVSALSARGETARYVYGRYLPRLSYLPMQMGRRLLLRDTEPSTDHENHQKEKAELMSGKYLSTIYELSILVDYFPQLYSRLAIPLLRSGYVVCDRYVYDTLLTDLGGDVIGSTGEAIDRYKTCSPLIPTPDIEFFLDVTPERAIGRKDDIPSIEYLEHLRPFYAELSERRDMVELDGEAPLEAVTRRALAHIDEECDSERNRR